jgi:YVTN family beta-propeller protein
MMHTTGRPVFRHGSWALGNLALLLSVGIVASEAPAQAQPRAFVANTKASTVTLIDTATDTRISFDVGAAPGQVVASPDGTHAYVANTGSNSISVIDIANNHVDTLALAASPTSLALASDGTLYVMDGAGSLQICDPVALAPCASVFIGASTGRIAVTPGGDRVYIASELVYEYDVRTGRVSSFAPDTAEGAVALDHGNSAVDVAILPDGRLYVAVVTYHYDWRGFSVDGGIVVFDTSGDTPVATQTIPLFSLPGSIALSADGKRAFVGIQAIWADTLYGAGFLPGQWVANIDTVTNTNVAWTDLGAEDTTFTATHTAADLAVAPDRSVVFVSVPNIDAVLEISAESSLVTRSFKFEGGGPTGVAIPPNPAAKPKAFTIEAVDDGPSAPLSAASAGIAVANVLANDKIGGAPATPANVTLALVSSSSPSVTLDIASGAVRVAADAEAGSYSLTYQICDVETDGNCGQAIARVSVRPQFTLHATDDTATSYAGVRAIASVLSNDLVDASAAGLDTVALSVASSDAGITLNADGSVFIAAGTAPGSRSLAYQICDLSSAGNCAAGNVTVTIVRRPIAAGADNGSAARSGGIAVANVLANDTLEDATATLDRVTLASVSSTDPGVTLNTASGAVTVANGTAAGSQTLQYRVCEAASPDNCSDGTVSVTVRQALVVAVGESVRASNKNAGVAVKNVLANDSVGGVQATLANVRLSQVSISPSNTRIKLNADGSVSVMEKAGSGGYALVYQICEIEAPANCARATVTIDLSGKN